MYGIEKTYSRPSHLALGSSQQLHSNDVVLTSGEASDPEVKKGHHTVLDARIDLARDIELESGLHVLPFSLVLPTSLPCSMQFQHAGDNVELSAAVIYSMKAMVEGGEVGSLVLASPLIPMTVLPRYSPPDGSARPLPLRAQIEKKLRACGCIPRGRITVGLTAASSIVRPGGQVRMFSPMNGEHSEYISVKVSA